MGGGGGGSCTISWGRLGGGGSLVGRTLSQERVRYVTVQVIVLADSGCRVHTW